MCIYNSASDIEADTLVQNLKPFRLLDLPAELQLRIIEFAVVKDSPVCINLGAHAHTLVQDPTEKEPQDSWAVVQKQGQHLLPSLCQVSKGIRADAVKMYYQKNNFIVAYCGSGVDEALDRMRKWLSSLGPTRRGLLRELQAVDAGITYDYSNDIFTNIICWDSYGAKEMVEEMEGAAEAMNEPGVYRVSFPVIKDQEER